MKPVRVLLFTCLASVLTAALPARAAGRYPELVGRLGVGLPDQVVVRDHYVYCTTSESYGVLQYGLMAVIDVADPEHPVAVGVCELPLPAKEIAVSGDYAYVVTTSTGWDTLPVSTLCAVSIAHPERPSLVGRLDFDEPIGELTADGDCLYALAREGGLLVIGVADPGNPQRVGSLAIPEFERFGIAQSHLVMSGAHAYVSYFRQESSEMTPAIRIVSIADPTAPIAMSDYLMSVPWHGISGMCSDGARLYLTRWGDNAPVTTGQAVAPQPDTELMVLDLSAPTTPVELGGYVMHYASAVPFAAAGEHVYLSVGGDPYGWAGMRVMDVSDPAAITKVGEYYLQYGLRDFALWGATAYVTDWYLRLRILDVSDPFAPTQTGEYYTQGHAYDVAVSGETAWMASGPGAVQAVDVSDPAEPVDIGRFPADGFAEHVVARDNLVVCDVPVLAARGLRVFDVSNPTAPVELGSWADDTVSSGDFYELVMKGDYLYASSCLGGGSNLYIINLSNPAAPTTVGHTWLDFYPDAADTRVTAVSGGYAYGASYWARRLAVIDVSNPTSPHVSGSCPLSGYPNAVAVAGPYAFVTTMEHGLSVVDVSDPAAPVEVAVVDLGTSARDIEIVGDLALISKAAMTYVDEVTALAGLGALIVVDISDPLAPREIARYQQTGHVGEIAVLGEYVYACEDERGLMVFRLNEFRDVTSQQWACDYISACAEAGLVSGYPDGSYHPGETVTRDQMAVYLARATCDPMGEEGLADYTPPIVPSFRDVWRTHWAYKYIEYATARGIASGYPGGYYRPSLPVDRGQMAVFVSRAVAGSDAAVPPGPAEASFADVPTDFWAYKYVEYLRGETVIGGYPDGFYHPEVVVTRDQMAVYVARAFDLPM